MTTEIQQSKGDAMKEFTSVITELQTDLKALTTGVSKQISAKEARDLRDEGIERLKRLTAMFKAKGQRRQSKGGVKSGNKGVCQPIVIHTDLRNFFIKAANLGMSQPYNYEYSKGKEFSDSQDIKHDYRLTTETGEVLYGAASCGKGIANKPSKTNVPILDIIKNIRRGITSSSQLTCLFSIYMRINNLKTANGSNRCDAHMEKYLGDAFKFLEATKGFKRESFKQCNFMQIAAFYTKKDVETATPARVKEWADKCGMSIAEFTKSRSYTKEERDTLLSGGKVREDVVKAVEEETAAVSQANSFYGHHTKVVPVKKERAPKAPKVAKPAVEAASGSSSVTVTSASSSSSDSASAASTAAPKKAAPAKAAAKTAAAPSSSSTASAPATSTAKTAPAASKPAAAPSSSAVPTKTAPATKAAPAAKPAPAAAKVSKPAA